MAKTKPSKTSYQVWVDTKERHPNKIILLRVGDFYETYEGDAKICAEVLGITLCKRKGTEIGIAGFPYHALDTYLPKLIRNGHAVCIADAEEQKPTQIKSIDSFNNNSNNTTMNENKTNNESINVVENEPKQTITALGNQTGYLFRNNSLQEVHITSYEVDLDAKVAKYFGRVGGGEIEELPLDGDYYESEQCFTNGIKADAVIEVDAHYYLSRISLHKTYQAENETWIYNNGRAELWKAIDHVHKMRVTYSPSYRVETDCEIPGDTYRSAQACHDWNEYKQIDGEGNEKIIKGEYSPLRLTEEQNKAVREFEQMMHKLAELNVTIVRDCDNDNIYAVNAERLVCITWDEDEIVEDEQHKLDIAYHPSMLIRGNIINIGCDTFFVMKND